MQLVLLLLRAGTSRRDPWKFSLQECVLDAEEVLARCHSVHVGDIEANNAHRVTPRGKALAERL